MEQMRHMAQLHETKFKSQGREVPTELKEQYAELSALEQEVTAAIATKEEELLHLKADRQTYSTELKLVTTWLTQAMEQLQERVVDIPEAIYRHEVRHCILLYWKCKKLFLLKMFKPKKLYKRRTVNPSCYINMRKLHSKSQCQLCYI